MTTASGRLFSAVFIWFTLMLAPAGTARRLYVA
jgi:hypothetical protein